MQMRAVDYSPAEVSHTAFVIWYKHGNYIFFINIFRVSQLLAIFDMGPVGVGPLSNWKY